MKHILEGKQAVLFDLDGTLVDSMWMWREIDIEFLGRFGLDCPEDLQRAIEGMSFTENAVYFKQRFSLPMTLEEIKECWTKMSIDKYRNEVTLKPGALEFLKFCQRSSIRTGVATSNGRDLVDAVIESLGIGKYLHVVTTACEVAAGKPEPDIYLEVARRLEVLPKACLVMEDIPAGILAGKRAGMAVCAIADDFSRDIEAEKKGLADVFVRDYFELMEEEYA